MKRIDQLTQEFQFKLEEFLTGCDAIEELDEWNKEEYGEMDGFYQNDLISVILRLIAVDGEISDAEVEYLNKNFGFEYTTQELTEVYKNCKEEVGHSFDESFQKGVVLMRSINEKLAERYRELLSLICDIIIESDDVRKPEEIEEAKRLKALF